MAEGEVSGPFGPGKGKVGAEKEAAEVGTWYSSYKEKPKEKSAKKKENGAETLKEPKAKTKEKKKTRRKEKALRKKESPNLIRGVLSKKKVRKEELEEDLDRIWEIYSPVIE